MPKRINRNQALSTSFKLEIPGLEEVNYFIQSAPFPGINMPGVDTPYMNKSASVPSNRIEYDPLNLIMLVDEDFENRNQIQLWMHKYAYGDLPINAIHKDITLHLLNSNKVPFMDLIFHSAYPTAIGELTFESGTSDPSPMTCSLTFRYQWYETKRLNE